METRYEARQGPDGALDDWGVWDRTLRQWQVWPRYSERRARALAEVSNGGATRLPVWW